MRNNTLYLVATLIALIVVAVFTGQSRKPAEIDRSALPANGLVGGTTTAAANTNEVSPVPNATAAATASPAVPATAPAANDSDDVPPGAEISDETTQPAASATTPKPTDGTALPPSEGQ